MGGGEDWRAGLADPGHRRREDAGVLIKREAAAHLELRAE